MKCNFKGCNNKGLALARPKNQKQSLYCIEHAKQIQYNNELERKIKIERWGK